MSREPHRCPLCDGGGQTANMRTREMETCKGCKGTGVVWEPDPQESAEMQPAPDDILDLTGS